MPPADMFTTWQGYSSLSSRMKRPSTRIGTRRYLRLSGTSWANERIDLACGVEAWGRIAVRGSDMASWRRLTVDMCGLLAERPSIWVPRAGTPSRGTVNLARLSLLRLKNV